MDPLLVHLKTAFLCGGKFTDVTGIPFALVDGFSVLFEVVGTGRGKGALVTQIFDAFMNTFLHRAIKYICVYYSFYISM